MLFGHPDQHVSFPFFFHFSSGKCEYQNDNCGIRDCGFCLGLHTATFSLHLQTISVLCAASYRFLVMVSLFHFCEFWQRHYLFPILAFLRYVAGRCICCLFYCPEAIGPNGYRSSHLLSLCCLRRSMHTCTCH